MVSTKLSAEMRRKIWRLCLPHRVFELDRPVAICTYIHEPTTCALSTSTHFNARPPFITRVCLGSREVAFEEGTYNDEDFGPDIPDEVDWVPSNVRLETGWRDLERMSFFYLD
jgi:hypothetical protein